MHWISSFSDRNIVAYFDSFGIENILLEVLKKIWDIFRIQDNESVTSGFYWIAFI